MREERKTASATEWVTKRTVQLPSSRRAEEFFVHAVAG